MKLYPRKSAKSADKLLKAAIKYCREHDILKEFLENNSSEVFNMLITEWDTEKAKQVWYEEGREEGMEKGREKEREAVAQNALAKGLPLDLIHDITGLDKKTIEGLGSK